MGMFQFEQRYSCPVCGASTTRKENMNSQTSHRVGACNVCGYERKTKPPRTRNAIALSYLTIPSGAKPREGIQRLAENANIPTSEAADVLNPKTDTTLTDIEHA